MLFRIEPENISAFLYNLEQGCLEVGNAFSEYPCPSLAEFVCECPQVGHKAVC